MVITIPQKNWATELTNPDLLAYIYYLLTGCKCRTRKYKPKAFHTAQACEGCLENQGLVFLVGTSTQLVNSLLYDPF